MTGRTIADNWRTLDPFLPVDVNEGVADARAWCRARNIPLGPGTAYPPPPTSPATSVTSTKEMKGFVAARATGATHEEYQAAAERGREANSGLMCHLDLSVADLDASVTSPAHQDRGDGYVDSPRFGGRCPVSSATVNLLLDAGDASKKQMRYRLFFTGADGRLEVCFPDLPETVADGEEPEDALAEASDCLASVIAVRILRKEGVEPPSPLKRGQRLIPVPLWVAPKPALYLSMREQRMSNSELARRLGCRETVVRRMLDPAHETRQEKIASALRAVGKRLLIAVENAA